MRTIREGAFVTTFSMMFRRAGWLFLAAPFFGVSTGAMFPLVALELNRLGFGEAPKKGAAIASFESILAL